MKLELRLSNHMSQLRNNHALNTHRSGLQPQKKGLSTFRDNCDDIYQNQM